MSNRFHVCSVHPVGIFLPPKRTHENFRYTWSSASRPDEHLSNHALAWEADPSGSYPAGLIAGWGFFPVQMSREPASRHMSAETWRAPLRRVLAIGHAETSKSTGQQVTENDRALNPSAAWRSIHAGSVADGLAPWWVLSTVKPPIAEVAFGPMDSEPCGFPFLSHSRSGGWKRIAAPRECSMFSLGGLLCSLLFPFLLISPSPASPPQPAPLPC